jgi:sugar lactone lactonase YvrE
MTTWCIRPITEPILLAPSTQYHDRLGFDRPCFAAMLGGPDRRTLFMLTAEWRGTEAIEDVVKARTGQVLVADAPAPGVGWP